LRVTGEPRGKKKKIKKDVTVTERVGGRQKTVKNRTPQSERRGGICQGKGKGVEAEKAIVGMKKYMGRAVNAADRKGLAGGLPRDKEGKSSHAREIQKKKKKPFRKVVTKRKGNQKTGFEKGCFCWKKNMQGTVVATRQGGRPRKGPSNHRKGGHGGETI